MQPLGCGVHPALCAPRSSGCLVPSALRFIFEKVTQNSHTCPLLNEFPKATENGKTQNPFDARPGPSVFSSVRDKH